MSGPVSPSLSVILPVYRNAESLAPLVADLGRVLPGIPGGAEAVFVVDGSPDDSAMRLMELLPKAPFPSQVLLLSRNFGSFNAVRAGLEAARGENCAAIAADLQEPTEILARYAEALGRGDADVVFGRRTGRSDPYPSRLLAQAYWALYRRFVLPDVPAGGIDTFACTRKVRDVIVGMGESNTSLVGLLVWVGFRRSFVDYERLPRRHGRSAWTLGRKFRYLLDSVFGFSDLPLRLLLLAGTTGVLASSVLGLIVILRRLLGGIEVPGYTALMTAMLFFGALQLLGIGILGGYVWRTFENSKRRPNFVVAQRTETGSP
jgi:glycosyltransferase involved in cell wall biosynthesis